MPSTESLGIRCPIGALSPREESNVFRFPGSSSSLNRFSRLSITRGQLKSGERPPNRFVERFSRRGKWFDRRVCVCVCLECHRVDTWPFTSASFLLSFVPAFVLSIPFLSFHLAGRGGARFSNFFFFFFFCPDTKGQPLRYGSGETPRAHHLSTRPLPPGPEENPEKTRLKPGKPPVHRV